MRTPVVVGPPSLKKERYINRKFSSVENAEYPAERSLKYESNDIEVASSDQPTVPLFWLTKYAAEVFQHFLSWLMKNIDTQGNE